MYLRSLKKKRKDVSLHDPIGTDKEGNEFTLIDILGKLQVPSTASLLLNKDGWDYYCGGNGCGANVPGWRQIAGQSTLSSV